MQHRWTRARTASSAIKRVCKSKLAIATASMRFIRSRLGSAAHSAAEDAVRPRCLVTSVPSRVQRACCSGQRILVSTLSVVRNQVADPRMRFVQIHSMGMASLRPSSAQQRHRAHSQIIQPTARWKPTAKQQASFGAMILYAKKWCAMEQKRQLSLSSTVALLRESTMVSTTGAPGS